MPSAVWKSPPRDVQVTFRKGLTGCAWARSRRISAPRPLTRRALHVYLHEIAHVVLEHFHDRPVHEQEFEAEEWALGVMQREGIGVPRASLERAQAYVAQTILCDSQATAISLRAAQFARAYL